MKKLTDSLYYCGVLDPDLEVFDIVMRTEFGTTYNSYVLKGNEKTALIETAKLKFYDQFESSLKEIVDISDIDYIVVNHTEPDHAGSIEKLIEQNPNIKIVGTATALGFLKHIVNRDFYSIPVKENDVLQLGGKTLHFMVLPNLHWPDTMYSYLIEDGILFTCDSFGSHYSHEGILRSTVTDEEGYMRAAKYYFDNIIGPYKNPYMTKALNRIDGLDINMICTGHGPVLDSHIEELIQTYREWCAAPAAKPRKSVVIPYVSAYGYTKQLAEQIEKGITDSGDIDVVSYDMVTSDAAEVSAAITAADGLLFGTPTIIGEALAPIWSLVTSMFSPIHKGKLASAFGSYGWSGEGVPHIIERLKQLKLKVLDGFRVRFKPSENELLDAYDFGYNFGCKLLGKDNDRLAPASGKPQLVKCLVCGEVFDSSLESCPVCGVGKENFVPVDDDYTGFSKNTDERFVILGGGAAAYNAAKAIRQRNTSCKIELIYGEKPLPYNRPMLTKSMMADFTGEQLAISDRSWYEENSITVTNDAVVQAVDTEKKIVTCTDGRKISYDKLIYALGAHCFIPPFPGADQPHVVAIRSIADAGRVRALLDGAKNAVVIGGGVLGLEAAWELHKSKLNVTVLEASPQIMGRQLDAGAADILGGIMKKQGINLVSSAAVSRITGDAVELNDAQSFPADIVIISCGVKPNVEIAQAAGIYTERAIVVNEHMATSADDVYACGDCAEYSGINYALWSEAVEMGKVAGASAAGDAMSYETVSGALTFNGMGTSLFALGDNGKQDKPYRTVEFRDDIRGSYEKYYFLNNRLSGVILIGDTSKMASLTTAIEEHAQFKDVIKF